MKKGLQAPEGLFVTDPGEKKKRTQNGKATADVVLSAHVADNSEIFPQVMYLHVPLGSVVADITYGTGVFWRNMPRGAYKLRKADLKLGMNFNNLPFADETMDAVIFDPPYMEGLYRRSDSHLAGSGTHTAFRNYYSSGQEKVSGPKYHDAVLDVYIRAEKEVSRVLKNGGKYIVKCQDEVSANRQKLTHVELIYAYSKRGYYCKDLFVCVRKNRPGISRLLKQEHARKNHSYFLVFEKTSKKLKHDNFRPFLIEDRS